MRYRDLFESLADGQLSIADTGGEIEITTLRTEVINMMQQWRQSGTVFKNTDTGIVIEISRGSINKSVRVAEPLLRLHFALPFILTKGKLLKREPPRPGSEQSLVEVIYFGAEVTLEDKLYRVVALVKHQANGHYHYSLAADDLRAQVAGDAPPGQPTGETGS